MRWLLTLLLVSMAITAHAAEPLPIIDAHSQLEKAVDPERVIALMDQAGVSRTILAARHGTSVQAMKKLAKLYPDRITAAVRSKSEAYQDGALEDFRAFLGKQLKHPEFAAMAEVLIYHGRKTNKKGKEIAPEVAYPPDHERVQMALDAALARGWPFVAHIEFARLAQQHGDGARAGYMAKFEDMVRAHPKHAFALIHMGQLDAIEAARLINSHSNVYFIAAHVTDVTLENSHEPWTAIIVNGEMAPAWKRLVLQHPDRFVLGFDNVWAGHWEKWYVEQVQLWRRVLADFPPRVAHAITHENAERLWSLPPATLP